jgi:stringent starvation protein B
MLDQKPYLVRALYDWIVDSHCTPYLQFSTAYPGV